MHYSAIPKGAVGCDLSLIFDLLCDRMEKCFVVLSNCRCKKWRVISFTRFVLVKIKTNLIEFSLLYSSILLAASSGFCIMLPVRFTLLMHSCLSLVYLSEKDIKMTNESPSHRSREPYNKVLSPFEW